MPLVVPPSSGAAPDEPTGPLGDTTGPSIPTPRTSGATGDEAVTAAVGRLAPEYAGRVGPHLVVRVVRTARKELGGSPVGAMPELVERLARYRLDRHIA
jgi:hypothetical protein